MNHWEPVIGLEVHVQLSTDTKMFCNCKWEYGCSPNTLTCPICLGMPGALPVTNTKAIDYAIKIGLALNCNIRKYTKFARKNYFYPDLPKGYQISQFEDPICENGFLSIYLDGKNKKIGITRAHMEEDAGKLMHGVGNYSVVDLNRCGTPLVEIVSEPDIRSSKEAHNYLDRLKQTLRYIGVSDCDMEKGNLRCDANISIRKEGTEKFGTRTEIKNLNSFRYVERAINYEIKRQIGILENNGKVDQCTMMWDENVGKTYVTRSKEEAHDYRYFPEPDLPPLVINEDKVENIKKNLPELPDIKERRLIQEYGIKQSIAKILTKEIDHSKYFEDLAKKSELPDLAANWILGDIYRVLKEENIDIKTFKISTNRLAELLQLLDQKKITKANAREVFNLMLNEDSTPLEIIQREGYSQQQNLGTLESTILRILEDHTVEVERYHNGEKKLIGFFMGLVMRETKGKADPKTITKIIGSLLHK